MATTTRRIGLVVVALLAAACGSRSPSLQAVELSPAAQVLPKGLGADLRVTALYTDGSKRDVTAEATFATSDAAVATVAGARVTTVVQGVAHLTATWQAHQAEAVITVTDAELLSIDVTGPGAALPKGASLRLQAFGHYTDGTTVEITGSASWGCPEGTLAFHEKGKATGAAVGAGSAVAALGEVSGALHLDVTAAELLSLRVEAQKSQLPVGLSAAVSAVATYTDGEVDVSGDATFTSTDETVLASNPDRTVKALRVGDAAVAAAFQGQTAQSRLIVTPAEITALRIALSGNDLTASVAVGGHYQFLAFGTFTDNNEYEVTSQVIWSAPETAVAALSNAAGSEGQATGLAAGVATVTASLSGALVSASASLSVSAPDLVGLSLACDRFTPPTYRLTLALGEQVQVDAIGTYSDGSTRTITGEVAWESWAPTAIDVQGGLVDAIGYTNAGSVYVSYADPATGDILFGQTFSVKVK